MFLRATTRKKDGKDIATGALSRTHASRGRVVQRHVLYLGEINDTQELAWRKSIEVLEDGAARPTLSLFAEDRVEGLLPDASVIGGAVGVAAASATAVGWVLAGADAVAGAAARSVLVEAAGAEPQRDALGSGAFRAGRLPPAGAGQRVAAASGVV